MASTFMASGTTPTKQDAKRILLLKILVALQGATGLACNDPARNDTIWALRVKIVRARQGICGWWQNLTPAVPFNINCITVGGTSFEIDWNNGALPQTGVEVWIKVNAGAYALAATVGPAVTSYTSGGPYTPGVDTVCGKVRAVNGSNKSAFSAECCRGF